ncbi:Transcription initiation factor TFIID, subunit TAF10 [Trachipleistophora hominis]|uniref:Transcription initiation factor TFIID, subunit TAF10 n=1 Tax=Trachipleistophora hominis TaxID=72359 RepID=L7JW65_TRAHO|nr:Transcription initiation factor TFIID, subunit TAF10 [Trachipleistophora hominis]
MNGKQEKDEKPKDGTTVVQPKDEGADINLDDFTPLIPDIVLDHLLERSGVDCADKETKKAISLLAQKFITDVATSSFQFHKIHQKAAQKDKRFPKEKKLTLHMNDLEKALEEYGIDVSRPSYFM